MPWEMVDVLILTARRDEYVAVLEVDSGALPEFPWERRMGPRGLEVAFRTFQAPGGGTLRVAVTCLLERSGVAKPQAAASLVRIYSPRCLAVCGVCEGRKGAVQPGDVIIADQLWLEDLDTLGNLFPYQLSTRWKQAAGSFEARLGGIVMPGTADQDPEHLSERLELMRSVLGLEGKDSVLPALVHRQDVTYRLVVKAVTDPSETSQSGRVVPSAARAAAEFLLAFLRAQLPPMQRSGGHIQGTDAELEALLALRTWEPPGVRGPVALLNVHHQFIDFSGSIHPELMQEIQSWCAEDEPISVRLFHGAAGSGKTRLFIEGCRQLRDQGWRAGFVDESVEPDCFESLVAAASERPTLAVIDRAESHPGLGALLQAVVHRRNAGGLGRFRLVLIAREVGGWWEMLQRRSLELRKLLKDRLPMQVAPLAPSGREAVFWDAANQFAAILGRTPPARLSMALDDPRFDRVLTLHMAALASALELTATPETLMEELLRAEERTWGPLQEHLPRLLDGKAGRWEPDLLGEALLLQVLRKEGATAGQWLRRMLDGRDGRAARAAFELLGRLSASPPEAAPWMASLLEGAVRSRAVYALEAVKALGQRPSYAEAGRVLAQALEREGTPQVAEKLDAAGLPEFTPSLREVAVWVKTTLLNHLDGEESAQTLIEGARLRSSLGSLLSALGRREEALAFVREVVARYRTLAEAHPEIFRPDLALGLADLGVVQGELGQREEALASLQEAVAIRRELTAEHPEEFLPSLAVNLNGLAGAQSALGRREEALNSMQEAVSHYQVLSEKHPEMYLPELAASLNNLSSMQGSLGRQGDSLSSIRAAVGHYRRLAKKHPESALPELAGSLTNLGILLGSLGQREESLTAVQEAVGLYRQLLDARLEEHLPRFAASLNSLSVAQSALGQRKEALASIQEAVEIRRKLAETHPQAFLPDLAMSLANLSIFQNELGQREEALASVREAAGHYRKLAEAYSAAYLPALAICLSNLAAVQSSLGRSTEALAPVQEAVEYYRRLARMLPAMFLGPLASSLSTLGSVLSGMERWQEALAAVQEAVELRRKLAEEQPKAVLPELALSLSNLGTFQSALGRGEEALASLREAVELRRRLVAEHPEAFEADLAISLNNLGSLQGTLGRAEEALASLREAVELRRKLAAQHPDAFSPDLAVSLTSLGKVKKMLGQREEALASLHEALDILWPFFLKLPAAFASITGPLLHEVAVQQHEVGSPPPATWKERVETWAVMNEKAQAKVH
jgi:tetratricopeptide (TPR) repeat protein